MAKRTKILWAEDDVFHGDRFVNAVRDAGFEVLLASTGKQALRTFRDHIKEIAAVILDIMMPPGEGFDLMGCHGGFETGLVVAREIKRIYPAMPVMAVSAVCNMEVEEWFQKQGNGFIEKPCWPKEVVELVLRVTKDRKAHKKPKCFIVHGHSEAVLRELKDYLQNTLGFPAPVVLRELPSYGRTIIEKFEDVARGVDLAFVLLTPDDKAVPTDAPNDVKRRARQNVIFEMGYFLARFQRKSGRVIILYQGEIELPSDISGVIYIDITSGISNSDVLLKELSSWI